MRKNNIRITALAFAVLVVLSFSIRLRAQVEKAPYPAMAPLDQYLISDENTEIALARSAAPASISDAADVIVLRRDGYTTAVKGSNGAFTFGDNPRNSVIGPRFVNLDTSVQKDWALRESMNLQFRADVYDTLNHANFTLPGRIFGASNFAVISSALDPREIQLALKLIF